MAVAGLEMFHDSQDQQYRNPFGAVACGQVVTLCLRIAGAAPDVEVQLRLWLDGEGGGEKLVAMQTLEQGTTGSMYSAAVAMPDTPRLVWYYFILRQGGKTWYYGNNTDRLGGVGTMGTDFVPPSFQITVHLRDMNTPEWFKHTVLYQIFIDRFHNASPDGRVHNPKIGSVLQASWENRPFYVRDPATQRIVAYDFFGGNLAGVKEKLGYLQELGIGAIYFNPLFEAQSNHRYDTGDYHRIDPMIGDNAEFSTFCQQAAVAGVRVLLDGVFSHTGSDSKYFNRYGTYPTLGAYQGQDSPYYSWYRFEQFPGKYDSWWGIDTLPNVNEMEPTYLDFIIRDQDAVVPYWLRQGAKGWRLDVVDELPDAFVKALYQRVKETDPEAVVIGEVWEDASNKASYGIRREYLYGEELDSVMNYPFRRIVLDFLLGQHDAGGTQRALLNLRENYPLQHFYSLMNLLGSHDVPRILTILGEAPDKTALTAQEQHAYRLPPAQRRLGVARVKLAVLWQMTFPGVPCIYYGDEAGMEGHADPYNRGAFPWGREDVELLAWHKELSNLRGELDCLRTGEWQSLAFHSDVYGYIRQIREGRDVFGRSARNGGAAVLLNRSRTETVRITIPAGEWCPHHAIDWLGGRQEVPVQGGSLHLELAPLEGKLLVGQEAPRLQRGAGILLHPTSLPGRHGIGDLGPAAERFIDFLAAAGQRYWQVLPLHPLGMGNSPYQSPSAFAGNPLLISPDRLVEQGWLREEETAGTEFSADQVDYDRVAAWKDALLRGACERFLAAPPADYADFIQQEDWLEDYTLFAALKEHFQRPWNEWPQELVRRQKTALGRWRKKLARAIEYRRVEQYWFFSQWQALHAYATAKGVQIIGDIPIFVAHDSADVWAHPELFKLDADGKPSVVAGVPPDYFSPTGQRWGNPHYQWEKMARDDYSWWARRLERLLKVVDAVRVDHFRGFEASWEIPATEETAKEGTWVAGPGRDFFQAMERKLGPIPWIAEDLGVITPEVEALRDLQAMPGMRILQFDLEWDARGQLAPLTKRSNTVVYSGTHDNATMAGWYGDVRRLEQGERLRNALGLSGRQGQEVGEVCRRLTAWLYRSAAAVVILPLQDVFALDNRSRMNIPGTATGNWDWRYQPDEQAEAAAIWLAGVARETQRI